MLITIATLTLTAAAATAPADGHVLQIHAKKVLVGDGTTLEDALVVVEDGKIRSVGKASDANPDLPLVEHDGVLTAGIVVAQSQAGLGGEGYEEARPVLPTARVVHAFDPDDSDFRRALECGVTTMVLAPSAQNVVGGLTAVVKSDGGTVVDPAAQLALSFSQLALSRGDERFSFFFGRAEDPSPAAADGGLESTSTSERGARTPTSYSGLVRVLGELFGDEAGGSVAKAKEGALPVLIEAWDRNEVARALRFARQHGLKGALRGAPLAGDPELLPQIAESGLGLVLGPFEAGQRHRSLAGVAKLQAAGVPLAFALDGPENHPDQLRLSAVMAVQAGADVERTWAALTGDAARLAGVANRVGLVAAGHDADLVLWSGHPLDLTSRVEAVWVDGKRVHSASNQ